MHTGTAAVVSCESQNGELHPSNVRRVTATETFKISQRWQGEYGTQQPPHAKGNPSGLGKCRKTRVEWEARAAVISTGLVVDDLDQAFQMRGWRDLETTDRMTAEQREAYHDILDKGNARDCALYGKERVELAWF